MHSFTECLLDLFLPIFRKMEKKVNYEKMFTITCCLFVAAVLLLITKMTSAPWTGTVIGF